MAAYLSDVGADVAGCRAWLQARGVDRNTREHCPLFDLWRLNFIHRPPAIKVSTRPSNRLGAIVGSGCRVLVPGSRCGVMRQTAGCYPDFMESSNEPTDPDQRCRTVAYCRNLFRRQRWAYRRYLCSGKALGGAASDSHKRDLLADFDQISSRNAAIVATLVEP